MLSMIELTYEDGDTDFADKSSCATTKYAIRINIIVIVFTE